MSLNGEWDFSIGSDSFDRKITVPFACESELSGVGDAGFHPVVWYRRKFSVPKAMQDKQLLLHFGAVDLNQLPIYSQERAVVEDMTACSLIGSPASVAYQLSALRDKVPFDEIMAVSYIFDEDAQMTSYQLLKGIVDKGC